MSTRIHIVGLALLLAASAAAAQPSPPAASAGDHKVEITPYVGFQFGSWFTDYHDGGATFNELDIEESVSFGLIVDFAINRHAQIELLYNRQDTELGVPRDHNRSRRDVDLEVEQFHIGFLWQWLPSDEVRPFVVGSLGATSLDLEGGGDETDFSASAGGGVKLFFNDHVGARFEGRFYHTLVDGDHDTFCSSDVCFGYHDASFLAQFELKAGLVFAF